MTSLREWVNRAWGTLRPREADRELEEELRTHLEFAAEELQRKGESPEDAIKLGWAHGALITTFPGDTTMATLDQVRSLAQGGSARIQR